MGMQQPKWDTKQHLPPDWRAGGQRPIYTQLPLTVAVNLGPRTLRADIGTCLWLCKYDGGRYYMSVDWIQPQGLQFLLSELNQDVINGVTSRWSEICIYGIKGVYAQGVEAGRQCGEVKSQAKSTAESILEGEIYNNNSSSKLNSAHKCRGNIRRKKRRQERKRAYEFYNQQQSLFRKMLKNVELLNVLQNIEGHV